MRYIRVAVPVPHLEALTYAVPDDIPTPVVGARVVAALGTRTVTGVVTGHVAEAPEGIAAKAIAEVLDGEPFIPDDIIALAQWVAEYYACGAGDAIGAALPPRALVVGRPSGFRTVRVAHLTAQGHDVYGGEALADVVTGERQRQALELLASAPEGLDTATLARRGVAAPSLKRLAAGGLGGVPGGVRRSCRHPAQRPLGRRAARSVASHPARRRRRGGRDEIRRVRAGAASGAGHRRRGA